MLKISDWCIQFMKIRRSDAMRVATLCYHNNVACIYSNKLYNITELQMYCEAFCFVLIWSSSLHFFASGRWRLRGRTIHKNWVTNKDIIIYYSSNEEKINKTA